MKKKMKILWFAGNPGLYASRNFHNGGGWIASLQRELLHERMNEIELAVAFPWNDCVKDERDGVTYYGIPSIRRAFFHYQKKEQHCVKNIKRVVDDFQPDVIHVFGTEQVFGLVATCTSVPVIIHQQGVLVAYRETWIPFGMSWRSFKYASIGNFLTKIGLDKSVNRELRIFQACKNFMGRTEWDKALTQIFSPGSRYFYCSEMLRPEIYYSKKKWVYKNRLEHKIVSVISAPLYKGGDVILRAAKILKERLNISFSWDVYGVLEMQSWVKLTGVKNADVNVIPKGVASAEQLVDILSDADVFVHPSYIDNSPNSVCEAQVLGIPVVACNVGGVSSIIKHEETGMLTPSNDIFMMASIIDRVLSDRDLSEQLSYGARNMALCRHNPKAIIGDLLNAYASVIG